MHVQRIIENMAEKNVWKLYSGKKNKSGLE